MQRQEVGSSAVVAEPPVQQQCQSVVAEPPVQAALAVHAAVG
jgi:hypothetical protein